MDVHRDKTGRKNRSLTILNIGMVLSFALALLLSFNFYRQYQSHLYEIKTMSRLEKLRGELGYLNEATTMSAKMAAATGDLAWIDRYRQLKIRLNSAESQLKMTPYSSVNIYHQLITTNQSLENIENDAFDAVRQGQLKKANAILSSQAYTQQKNIYKHILFEAAFVYTPFTKLIWLQNEILRLDEVLTMSAQMAAATGNLFWEKHYLDNDALLTVIINEARNESLQIDPTTKKQIIDKTDTANMALVAMEKQAFQLTREGQLKKAQAILFSQNYIKQKKIYAEGLTEFNEIINKSIQAEERKYNAPMLYGLITIFIVIFLLFFLWIILYFSLRKYQQQLLSANEALAALNLDLEKKVTERTLALNQAKEKVEQIALFDFLTGLPNRYHFDSVANKAISFATRHNKKMAILSLDLDKFKEINDSYGHDVGDALLKEIGKRLHKSIRVEDLAARIGGDEFVILYNGLKDQEEAGIAAQRIIDTLRLPVDINNTKIIATTSIGIACFPRDGLNLLSLSKKADIAMYKAKHLGRNNYQFFIEGDDIKHDE